MMQQYIDLSIFGIQAGLHFFGKSSMWDVSYSKKTELCMRARRLLLLQKGIHSCVNLENKAYAGSALFLFLTFDRQALIQGGRFAMISIVRSLAQDSNIDFLDYLNSNGLKVPQVPWDPGGLELLIYNNGLGSSRVLRREGC